MNEECVRKLIFLFIFNPEKLQAAKANHSLREWFAGQIIKDGQPPIHCTYESWKLEIKNGVDTIFNRYTA